MSSGRLRSERDERAVAGRRGDERGVDISRSKPRLLATRMINEAALVVTVGCSVEEVCPQPMLAKMQKNLVDWHLDDPRKKPIDSVKEIRD